MLNAESEITDLLLALLKNDADELARQLKSVPQSPRILNVDDIPIGSDDILYQDHEVWQPESRFLWQDGNTDEVWLATILPESGELFPADGRGELVTVAAPFTGEPFSYYYLGVGREGALNGPEFGYSRQGLGVYFTTIDDDGVYQAARFLIPNRSTQQLTFGGTLHRRACLPSTDFNDAQTRIMYFEGPVGVEGQTPKWQYEYNPQAAQYIPLSFSGSSGLRWIPNRQACLTNVVDQYGVLQVAEYDILTQSVTPITSGPEEHYDGSVVADPVTGEPAWFVCTEAVWKIAVYRRENNTWVKQRTINPCISSPNKIDNLWVFGVKPFLFQGELFFPYALASGLPYINAAFICLASGDGSINNPISELSEENRADPEFYTTDDAIYIFYNYAWLPKGKLRRCRIELR